MLFAEPVTPVAKEQVLRRRIVNSHCRDPTSTAGGARPRRGGVLARVSHGKCLRGGTCFPTVPHALGDFAGTGWQAGLRCGTVVWLNSVSSRGQPSPPES
jgi:hypothetical protein